MLNCNRCNLFAVQMAVACCFVFFLKAHFFFSCSFVSRDPLPVVWLFFNSFYIKTVIISETGGGLQENNSLPLNTIILATRQAFDGLLELTEKLPVAKVSLKLTAARSLQTEPIWSHIREHHKGFLF